MNTNFTTVGYRPDFNTQTIILTKKFAKTASIVGSKDYTTLCRIRQDYPDYKVIVREIAKKEGKANPNRNLTFKNMRNHIINIHGENSEEVKEFNHTMECSKIQTGRYAYVKKWFLSKYPDVRMDTTTTTAAASAN